MMAFAGKDSEENSPKENSKEKKSKSKPLILKPRKINKPSKEVFEDKRNKPKGRKQ